MASLTVASGGFFGSRVWFSRGEQARGEARVREQVEGIVGGATRLQGEQVGDGRVSGTAAWRQCAMAHSDESEERGRLTVGPTVSDLDKLAFFCFSFLFIRIQGFKRGTKAWL